MTDEKAPPVFERGDVVYGDDPFKGDQNARPWLILSNHEGRPFRDILPVVNGGASPTRGLRPSA